MLARGHLPRQRFLKLWRSRLDVHTAQRLYLSNCATCHGARGDGSWRATVFLMRPGDLTDPRTMDALSDEYLHTLIKNGGATLGKPGMPAFGFHLTDEQIGELIRHLRTLPRR